MNILRQHIRKIIQESVFQESDSRSIIAFHGTRTTIPFQEFEARLIGSGLVSSSGRKYDGFFFTTEQENAEYFTEWFVAKVKIKNVKQNPLEEKHPPTVLSKAKEYGENYVIEDVLDGHAFSDIIVVPTNNLDSIEILGWEFVGDEESLFETYDKFFGVDDEEEGFFINQDMIDDTLDIIGIDLDFLLKIPVFKKYYDSKGH